MNFLTLVLSLILILSFGSFVVLEKQAGDRRLRTTYLGHLAANRKILSQHEREIYETLPSLRKSDDVVKPFEPNLKQEPKEHAIPELNPECARLNLRPLIQDGREAHPLLYDTTIKLLKTFYGHALFEDKTGAEDHFLNLFLHKAKEAMQKEPLFALEKLSLGSPWQLIYYRMLKGTKNVSPSLLDMIKVEDGPSKVCLQHAHPDLLSVFFGPKAALPIYQEIHKEDAHKITQEQIEQICLENHLSLLDKTIFHLLELHSPPHPKSIKVTWLGEDTDSQISFRKTIYKS